MSAFLDGQVDDLRFGSIASSLDTYASELRCFLKFCRLVGAQAMPPSAATVQQFVTIFRSPDSAQKYLTALRWASDYLGEPTSEWDNRSLRQVLRGALKVRGAAPRKKARAIRRELQRTLARIARRRGEISQATVYALAGTFLLRVPSEALPLDFEEAVEIEQNGRLALRINLKKRKNRPGGATLVRACSCPHDEILCPVHTLRDLVSAQRRQRRGRIFGMNPTSFNRSLRAHVSAAGSAAEGSAEEYSSQGFRRGTAQDIVRNGGSLAQLLSAGDWNSKAFQEYMDKEEIDQMSLVDLMCDEDEVAEERDPKLGATGAATKRPDSQRRLDDFFSAVERHGAQ